MLAGTLLNRLVTAAEGEQPEYYWLDLGRWSALCSVSPDSAVLVDMVMCKYGEQERFTFLGTE